LPGRRSKPGLPLRSPHSLSHRPPPHPSHQFVADGVFYAELNELLTRELAEQVRETGERWEERRKPEGL
jgi:hypothetical protein